MSGRMTKKQIEKAIEKEDFGLLGGADIPALFSAELPDEEITFSIGGAECSATIKPMTAGELALWTDLTSKFSTYQDEGGETVFKMEPDTAKADVALLVGSISNLNVVTRAKVMQDGQWNGDYETMAYPFPPKGRAREDFFQRLHPEFRRRLVAEAKRVNGLSPLPQE